jgi:transketolase
MRSLFPELIKSYLDEGNDLFVLLGDIGVHSFRDIFEAYPQNIENLGTVEQSMIGIAAGISIGGAIPVVHTITPFLIERAFEQLKIDFGYQKLKGNFLSVGGAFDYSGLGATHHCPADVSLIKSIPNFQCIVPGHAKEFEKLFHSTVLNEFPTYIRLSESSNIKEVDVKFGEAKAIKTNGDIVIITVGDMLDITLEATKNLPVTILYYTTLEPFDKDSLTKYFKNKILIVGSFYTGTLVSDVTEALKGKKVVVDSIGIPKNFIYKYGTKKELQNYMGLTVSKIKEKVNQLMSN